ncbi:MAG: globin [Actinomycetota bacterium]|nr:globin [Actinomycetota bacterium]
MEPDTVFAAVGGQPFFDALVGRFYERVENDTVLRPLYTADLEPGKRALALFLGQYWGGPPVYSEEKGHPRLRMRHAPFRITHVERAAWLGAMLAGLAEADVPPDIAEAMREYFAMAADAMVNS